MILPVITRTNLKRQSKKRKKSMMRKRMPIIRAEAEHPIRSVPAARPASADLQAPVQRKQSAKRRRTTKILEEFRKFRKYINAYLYSEKSKKGFVFNLICFI